MSLLILFADRAAFRAALDALDAREWAPSAIEARRRAVTRARLSSFATSVDEREAQIRAALPPAMRESAIFEPEPIFNAMLVHLPRHDGPDALAALKAAQASGVGDIAHVSLHPYYPVLPMAAAVAPPASATNAMDAGALDIALIDNGADASHPLLQHTFTAFDFAPGTPGADGRLMRSHGTAMLGLYARIARGERLVASGRRQQLGGDFGPFPLAHALITRAGPETPAGRNVLLRDLAWLMMPDAARPYPDLINYSQGNGALCASAGSARCRGTRWFGVTRIIDRLIDEQAVVVVKSAGNHGYVESTSMTVPGDTYNGITVGNMHAFDWTSCKPSADRVRHKIYRNSSVAPAPGHGPRLLDLVAPGVRVDTTGVDPAWCRARCAKDASTPCAFCSRLGHRLEHDIGYWKTNSGTSPAAAIVGAAAAGLMHAGTRAPHLVKAILINSADAWTSSGTPPPSVRGNGQGCREDRVAGAHGPYRHGTHYDRSYGWGYLNTAAAMREREHAQLGAILPGARICYRAELKSWDKLTLVWQRHASACIDCETPGWPPLQILGLALREAETPWGILDRDLEADRQDNVLQVANGRGEQAHPRARTVLVEVSAAPSSGRSGSPAGEWFALASRRSLTRLANCPSPLR